MLVSMVLYICSLFIFINAYAFNKKFGSSPNVLNISLENIHFKQKLNITKFSTKNNYDYKYQFF